MRFYIHSIRATLGLLFVSTALAHASDGSELSLKLEISRAIEKGVGWLNDRQDKNAGNWGDPQYPALTALALRVNLGLPDDMKSSERKLLVGKGFDFIRNKVQTDGGIYGKGLASYNTSISLMALLQLGNPSDEEIIRAARRFLVNQQSDFDRKGESDNVFDGGVGYGSTWAHSDMSNTHLALEALYYARQTLPSREGEELELDWEAAVQFVSQCQNLPETNPQQWVSSHAEDRGGFVYFPGSSMAGERRDENGSVSLRSYGSMSYAGLLSFIYAEMNPSDPRVLAVRKWLSENFSVDENPGMGKEGLFYYYHTLAKALSLSGSKLLIDSAGNGIDWRKRLAAALLDRQDADGFWINESGRWWERDPVLVSCYALLALERVYHAL